MTAGGCGDVVAVGQQPQVNSSSGHVDPTTAASTADHGTQASDATGIGTTGPSLTTTGTPASESSSSATSASTSSFGESTTAGRSDIAGAATGPAEIPQFADLTMDAGINYTQGVCSASPNCLIEQVGTGIGSYCTPERMVAGTAIGDVDGDSDLDLFVTRTQDTNILFRNNGDGTFTDVSEAAGFVDVGNGAGAAFGDIDNDGDLDLYATSIGSYRYMLYINDGTGVFTEEALTRGAALATDRIHTATQVGFGDYDIDGFLDIFVGEWRTVPGLGEGPSHSRLLRNLGAMAPGTFEDTTAIAGVSMDHVWAEVGDDVPGTYSFAPAFADFDGDRYPELAVTGDFRTSRLFWNAGDGTFVDRTFAAGTGLDRNGMGSTIADFDSDGDLDWYVTSISINGLIDDNRLYSNNGDQTFDNVADALGVNESGWGWGTLFFDANNDADLDLVAGSGYYYMAHSNEPVKFWSADGVGGFIDHTASVNLEIGRQRRGISTFDYDDDGDLDLLFTNSCDSAQLYRNENGNDGDWLRVRTIGTSSNTEGVGARVSVMAIAGAAVQMREIGAQAYFMGQSERIAHFGLPVGEDPVAEVQVYWPVTDQIQVFEGVARNSTLVVTEP